MANFLEACRRAMRYRHLSYHTEKSYLDWIEHFMRHFKRVKPQDMEAHDAREFLIFLANKGRVTTPTQNVAFSALLFLFRYVLEKGIGEISGVWRAQCPQGLPIALSRSKVRTLVSHLSGTPHLVASLSSVTAVRAWDSGRRCDCASRMWISTEA